MWTQKAPLLTIHTVLPCHSLAPLCIYEAIWGFSRDLIFPPISSLITRPPNSNLRWQTLPATSDLSWHFAALPVELCPFRVSLLRQASPPNGKCIYYYHEWLWQETFLDYFDVMERVSLQGQDEKGVGEEEFLRLKIWVIWAHMTQLASPGLSLPVSWILLVTVQSWPLRVWVCKQKYNKTTTNNTATHI